MNTPDLAEIVAAYAPMEVVPTNLVPKLPRLEGIRAVIFDLYGTLLISSAGGEQLSEEEKERRKAFWQKEGLPLQMEASFWERIAKERAKRKARGVPHPEIDVCENWAALWREQGWGDLSETEAEIFALRHQASCYPVWPMPGASELLAWLRGKGYLLGIISNAQAYTQPTMEAVFGATWGEMGFHPTLRILSYQIGEGKPSLRLYEKMKEALAGLDVGVGEVLYLGNDWRKDILPAKAVGFRVGLFAGDARSLRLGETTEEEIRETAEIVVTRWTTEGWEDREWDWNGPRKDTEREYRFGTSCKDEMR